MKAILRSGLIALAILALAVPASAGPYENGKAAYDRGDYARVVDVFRLFAEHGSRHAGNGG